MHGGSALQLQARRFLRPLLLLLRCWGSCCSGNGSDRFDSSGWTAVAAPTSSCFARIPALRPPPPPPRAQLGRSSCAREAEEAAALWRPLLAAARNCSCASPPALKPPRPPPVSLQDLGVPWKGGGEGCTLIRTHTYSHSHTRKHSRPAGIHAVCPSQGWE